MPSIFLQNFYSQKITQDESGQNKAGSDYANNLSQISIGSSSINTIDKINPNKETIYKLDIEYNIPSLSNENQKIVLYIKSAR